MNNQYASERYQPALPACSRSAVSLRFDGKTLIMKAGAQSPSYPAVSGRPRNGAFIYNLDRQKEASSGPIPAGTYWIQPSQMWRRSWLSDRKLEWWDRGDAGSHARAWGDQRITIHPFPDTQTYGRGGFFIHGGEVAGSIGCIDLTGDMAAFAKDLEAAVGSGNCYLQLVVDYASTPAR
jgi:hypothetical protein